MLLLGWRVDDPCSPAPSYVSRRESSEESDNRYVLSIRRDYEVARVHTLIVDGQFIEKNNKIRRPTVNKEFVDCPDTDLEDLGRNTLIEAQHLQEEHRHTRKMWIY